ncbi:MAG: ABC transporter substrate-binding protein [Candidatus Bathyarchaeota archaeon]|nr:ABC transporter substrate-binding protein [Candidatus Termitimicrobium sp.]
MKQLNYITLHKIRVNSRINPIRATPKLQTNTQTTAKGFKFLYLLIAVILIIASTYVVYSLLSNPDTSSSPSPSPMSPTPSWPTATTTPPTVTASSSDKTTLSTNTPTPTPEPKSITVIDGLGRSVTIKQPINRIVSINYGLTEIICALGCQNLIVGRDKLSITPPSVTSIPVVASSSNDPNLELLLESKPDLILADSMIRTKTQVLAMIEDAGIPIYIESTGNFSRILDCIQYMGRILNKEQTASELHDFLTRYQTLAADRIANVSPNQRPRVYVEWTNPWYTATHTSIVGLMTASGGINIAEGGLGTITMGDITLNMWQNPTPILS